ncbi:DNA polymerase III subunit delta [Pseudemcibacter aquimaris]|uniref:DNA polymerase III subunit delta n=1 Tax=Pseudemcibacter aquimaris TaxID=2857064 RepID=UPI0020132C2E|nr:DNA polymerase III subunit delta [Pseudemcibacter aquimaris]MCC3861986.1 DNA polymerase III subunit delta [Pseudemcibacter aquimaris]WDU58738.1 DNA polymerase III subunit delta [Pseudemcibacter aquimaris]
MKIGYRDIDAQIKSLSPQYQAVLVFGPDEGLVRERATKIAKQVVEDLQDPFLVANLDPDTLKSEPGILADEVAAISMMGGRRVIRVEGAAENTTKAATNFLENPVGDGLIVITAGNLRPTSGLRKLFEKSKNAAAIPCYEDNQASLDALIHEVMRENGLSIDPDAASFLQMNLGSDRLVSRSELNKLAIYMGPQGKRESDMVTLDDVAKCVGDSGALSIDTITSATISGDLKRLDDTLFKAFNRGENAIAVLRSLSRKINRMHLARGYMDQGFSADQAMGKLVPKVFAMEARRFKADLSKWTTGRLASAMSITSAAEEDCKTTGMPVEAICARACLRIANAAKR